MSVSGKDFDREQRLAELLPAAEAEKLCSSLTLLLGGPVAIGDLAGERLAGAHGLSQDDGTALVLELEPIGYLLAPAASVVARAAAANLIRQLLVARARYRMASGVHIASVQADYEKLAARHAELQASEARYRELSAELEARVAEQVRIIDERQRQLYQAERLASVGQLAAGVAHEINNPIGFLRSNLGTAQKYVERLASLGEAIQGLPGGARLWQDADLPFVLEDFSELLADSVKGADRVARIVADLKGFSNVDRPEEEVVDVNGLLDSACNMVLPRVPAGAELVREFAKLKPMLCLPGHLSQALLNVLTNAAQAIGDRGADGRLTVSSRALDDGAELIVEDNGVGIEAEDLSRIFDPFYTTRPVGQGTGLGLTVARDIVAAHGGRIALESAPGRGTRVSIRLTA